MRDRNQEAIQINYEIIVAEDDPVRKVVEICEQLDYTELNKQYLRAWRKVNPVTMFIILVFAYMNKAYSCRDIEHLCRVDVRFLWILNGEPVPDHATIARFQNEKLAPVIEDLFYQFVKLLIGMGEVSYRNVFIDGTKIEADANKYTFVWAKTVEKNRRKLRAKIEQELPEIARRNGISERANLLEALNALLSTRDLLGIEFVHGSGHRKKPLQRDCETLASYLEKLQQYDDALSICGKRKSYSKTDVDATFMRMKEDAMKNGQLKPGYNVQAAVESEYIVGLGLFSNQADTNTLIPLIERIQNGSGRLIQNVVADAGYASEENYTYLEKHNQTAYIKPNLYEKSKTKKYKNDKFRVENLTYEPKNRRYVCPNGKHLKFKRYTKEKSDNGFISTKSIYECEGCSGCPYRNQCYKGKQENRIITVSRTYIRQNLKATKLITSEQGNLLRTNRSIQVEGVWGVLKQDYGFRRFLTRGKRKTEAQIFLLAFAFNVQKLYNRIHAKRFGVSLFALKEKGAS